MVPHFAAAAEVKFVPLMVSVNAAPPATAEAGLRLVIVGGGGLMVTVKPAEVPPPKRATRPKVKGNRPAQHSSGGCFQNRLLTELTVARLEAIGTKVCWHQRVPPNDGGIALGQVVAAARKLRFEKNARVHTCV